MEPVIQRSWKVEFARSAAYRREQEQFVRETERRMERERESDRIEDDLADLVVSAVLASEGEIAAFRTTLDAYDAATVEALMENRRALDEVRTRIDDMLLKAYVLPDGRRVFKSEDGTQVFDEHGNELGPDEIDADAFEDWRPRYEAYAGAIEEERVLLEERQELLDFQERIDDIRGRLDEDGITQDELKELEAELKDTMPAAVQNAGGVRRTVRARDATWH